MASVTYPNGQTLASTALTPAQVSILVQTLTCQALGLSPVDYAQVRVEWQTQGQPFQDPSKDVCYVGCVLEDVEYTKVRDASRSGTAPITETWVYTRGWRFSWSLYGPNSTDRARMLHTAFIFMSYFSDQLSLSNLYPVSDPPEPTRTPENFNAQWWERADFHIIVYEQVTETITINPVTSVEVKVIDGSLGQVADLTITPLT
jgi:hypothetical protein